MSSDKRTLCTAAGLLGLALNLIACGYSPLFHHASASDINALNDRSAAPAHADCPLELPKSGLCASITWASALSSENENTATLRFWDKASAGSAGPYREIDGDVALVLWMPAMGHGSSPVTITSTGESGIYSASKIYFIMPGDWEVRLQIKKNHELFEQAVLPVTI